MTRLTMVIIFSLIVLFAFSSFVNCGMAGGWTKQDPSSENVRKLAEYGANFVDQSLNSNNHMKMVHIHEASTQVVAGIMHRIVFDMGHTKCRKNGDQLNDVLSSCDLDQERVSYYNLLLVIL